MTNVIRHKHTNMGTAVRGCVDIIVVDNRRTCDTNMGWFITGSRGWGGTAF